jgi:hypothetical protein
MSKNLWNRPDEEIAKEIVKPLEELLDKEKKELEKAEGEIREAERKAKPVVHPEP